MSPPARSKLRLVAGRCDCKGFPSNLMPEDAECPASVELGGHDQDPRAGFPAQTFLNVVGFVPGRQAFDPADFHRCALRKILHISLGELDLGKLVDRRFRWNVNQYAVCVSAVQKLHRISGAMIGLASQDNDDIRRLRRIHHKEFSGIQPKPGQHSGKRDCRNPQPPSSAPDRYQMNRFLPIPRAGFPPDRALLASGSDVPPC